MASNGIVFPSIGELQTILCATFSADGSVYTGTLNGEIYKWEGHTLQSVIKGAHQVAQIGSYRWGRGEWLYPCEKWRGEYQSIIQEGCLLQ